MGGPKNRRVPPHTQQNVNKRNNDFFARRLYREEKFTDEWKKGVSGFTNKKLTDVMHFWKLCRKQTEEANMDINMDRYWLPTVWRDERLSTTAAQLGPVRPGAG